MEEGGEYFTDTMQSIIRNVDVGIIIYIPGWMGSVQIVYISDMFIYIG